MGDTAIPLKRIAAEVGGELVGDPDFQVRGVCALDDPREGCLTFVKRPSALQTAELRGVAVIAPVAARGSGQLSMILVENPRYAFAQALNAFFTAPREACIAASARISPTASLGRGVGIGAGSIIGDDCVIGDDTQIRHNVIIGERVQIGARCLVKSNSVIGEEGFGFERGPDGKYLRLPHLGSVIIGDDVEIGALNTVCRGTVGPTTIGRGTKTDDHVHIAHNCSIGEDVIITACAELSGSVTVGDRAWLGPNSSIMNGITIEAGTVVGLGAVIGKSTEENGVYPGSHAALLRIKKR